MPLEHFSLGEVSILPRLMRRGFTNSLVPLKLGDCDGGFPSADSVAF
jgi:hypothetical protein